MAYQRGVISVELPTGLGVVQPADACIIGCVGAAPVHSVPGYQWSASGYASVVNALVLVEVPSDFTTQLGVSKTFGPGITGYGCAELYDYAMVENVAGPIGPLVFVNVWDPFTMSTPMSLPGLTIDNNGEISIPHEVILASLVVKGATTTYVNGVDYTFSYDDQTLQSGTITVYANSPLLFETTVTATFSTPNLINVTSDLIIGETGVDGKLTGLQLFDQLYDTFNVTLGQLIAPGFSQDPEVGAAGNARVQSLTAARFKATFIADADYEAVTNYSLLAAWKAQNNYESRFENLVWPNVQLGTDLAYHGSTVLAVTKANQARAFGNLPYVSPSNKPIAGTGTILKIGHPIKVGETQANYIETLGIATFVNQQGWKTLGDYTCSFDSGTTQATDPVDFWINESDFFIWMENTLSIFLAGEIDQPGNLTTLSTIENSIQQWGNSLIQAGACWTFRCTFNPDDNPAELILAGVYTFSITVSPVTPVRTIRLNFSYDVAGMTAAIQSIQLTQV